MKVLCSGITDTMHRVESQALLPSPQITSTGQRHRLNLHTFPKCQVPVPPSPTEWGSYDNMNPSHYSPPVPQTYISLPISISFNVLAMPKCRKMASSASPASLLSSCNPLLIGTCETAGSLHISLFNCSCLWPLLIKIHGGECPGDVGVGHEDEAEV